MFVLQLITWSAGVLKNVLHLFDGTWFFVAQEMQWHQHLKTSIAAFGQKVQNVGWPQAEFFMPQYPCYYHASFPSQCVASVTLQQHSFDDLFSRTTWVSQCAKDKSFWVLLKQRWWGGSGISWTICKSLHLNITNLCCGHDQRRNIF